MNCQSFRVVPLSGIIVLTILSVDVRAGELNLLLDEYRAQGVHTFDPDAGAALWQKKFGGKSCASCHHKSPRDPGRNERTGKAIKPLAPSANPERLTDRGRMKKWLLRNCKSTLGRECTAQEKGNVLTWLRSQ